jgi:1-acyl-sn-glycerol-3-phosphate acyltransferase
MTSVLPKEKHHSDLWNRRFEHRFETLWINDLEGPWILGSVRPSPFYFFVGFVSWPFVNWLFRLRAEGVENLPKEGGFVLAANHISNFDPWPLGMKLWPRRYLRFMAKKELFWWPLGPIIRSGGAFMVRRGERDVEAMTTAAELVRDGHIVVMFPHGTRQRKGLVKRHQPRSHTGAARIALEANAPLVPAAITGTDRLSRLGPLRVRYGKPLQLDGLDAREATNRLMAEIENLEQGL